MAKDEEKGNPVSDLKWLLIIILAIWFIGKFGLSGLVQSTTNTGKVTVSKNFSSLDVQPISGNQSNESKWKGMIKIGRGNSSGATHPNQEYITLQTERRNNGPINITSWFLTNGKDRKSFIISGNDRQAKGVSDRVTLSQGTLIFIPNGNNLQQDIVLDPGDEAIITTGKVPNGIPFEIKINFKENICTGYIEDLKDYNFTPSLRRNCPDPEDEEGVSSLDDVCYKFVNQMSTCHTPEFKDIFYKNKEPFTGYVDNVGNLSQQCKNFIKRNYSYESCVINHFSDENFFGKSWRIFLNYPRELWAKDREVITLYDSEGKMVDQLIYGY